MSEPEFLRQQAERCRRLASGVSDDRTIAALLRLAEDLERRAAEVVEPNNELPPPISG